MPNQKFPRIKRSFTVIAHSPDVVELRQGVWNPISHTLRDDTQSGRLYAVVSRLTGALDPAQVVTESGASREDIEGIIDHLSSIGALELDASNSLDHYLDLMIPTLKPMDNGNRSHLPVTVLGDEEMGKELTRLLHGSLPDLDIQVLTAEAPSVALLQNTSSDWLLDALEMEEQLSAFHGWKGRLLVSFSSVIHPPKMQKLNRITQALGISWIHAAVDGPFLFIGPLFEPRRSSCYECLDTRILMNARDSNGYLSYKNALAEGRARLGIPPVEPILVQVLTAHTAMEVLNYQLTGNSFLFDRMLSIYLPTFEFSFNEVLRLPGCPGCGALSERDESELYFDAKAVL